MNTTSNQGKSYFNLHTSGIGFLQRAREVTPEDADPYLSVTVAALVGPRADPVYRYFDVKVSGAEAQQLVSKYLGLDDPRRRPLVRFRIGDSWSDTYIRSKGERKGEVATTLKGRLLTADLIDHTELAKIEQHELITCGIGYLNRLTEIRPNQGEPFLACTIAAMIGKVDPKTDTGETGKVGPKTDAGKASARKRRYRYFDTVVTTEDAQHLVRRYKQAVEDDRKVQVAFRLSDMKADLYVRTKGDKAGQPAASLKSNLIHISKIKIDGQQVYPDPATNAPPPEAPEATASGIDGNARVAIHPQPGQPEAEVEMETEVENREPALATSF